MTLGRPNRAARLVRTSSTTSIKSNQIKSLKSHGAHLVSALLQLELHGVRFHGEQVVHVLLPQTHTHSHHRVAHSHVVVYCVLFASSFALTGDLIVRDVSRVQDEIARLKKEKIKLHGEMPHTYMLVKHSVQAAGSAVCTIQ